MICMSVCGACLRACSAVHALQRGWEEMRDETGEKQETLGRAVPSFHPCMQCEFCFMACGCIKPQSNNLVSSGAETTDISHGATVLYCTCEPQHRAAVHCHFTSSLHSFIQSLFSSCPQPLHVTNLFCVCLHYFHFFYNYC